MASSIVAVSPREFLLAALVNETQILNLQIHNNDSRPVAFKLKTTNPAQYLVRPAQGCIASGSSVECTVKSMPRAELPAKLKDKFLVQCVALEGAEAEQRTDDHQQLGALWKDLETKRKETGFSADRYEEHRIKIKFHTDGNAVGDDSLRDSDMVIVDGGAAVDGGDSVAADGGDAAPAVVNRLSLENAALEAELRIVRDEQKRLTEELLRSQAQVDDLQQKTVAAGSPSATPPGGPSASPDQHTVPADELRLKEAVVRRQAERLEQLQTEATRLHEQHLKSQELVADQEKELQSLREKIKDVQRLADQTAQERAETDKEASQHKEALAHVRQLSEDLQHQLDEAKKQRDALKASTEVASRPAEDDTKQWEDDRRRLEKIISSAKQEIETLKATNTALNQKLQTAQGQGQGQGPSTDDQELKQVRHELETQEALVAGLRGSVAELQSALQKERLELEETRRAQLRLRREGSGAPSANAAQEPDITAAVQTSSQRMTIERWHLLVMLLIAFVLGRFL